MDTVNQSWRLYIQLILGLGITALFFYMMAPFLIAILLGAITAILCYPVYQQLRKYLPKMLSGLIVTVGVTLGVLLPLTFILINGAYKLLDLTRALRITSNTSLDSILHNELLQKVLRYLTQWSPLNAEWFNTQLTNSAHSLIESLSRGLGTFLGQLSGFMLDFAILILSIYFLTVDGAKLLRFLSSISPVRKQRAQELFHAFESSCRGVVLGMFASSVVQGILITLFFLVLSLPSPFLFGVFAVILGFVPVVGTAPITLGAIIYLVLQDRITASITMGVAALLVAASDNIVRPWVMRGQSEMHPLLALVSALGALNLMGATGIFLGPIIAAVFLSFLRILAQEIQREKQMLAWTQQPPSSDDG